jgi:FecR protein
MTKIPFRFGRTSLLTFAKSLPKSAQQLRRAPLILIRRLVAVALCFFISPIPAICEPQTEGQRAGQITALIPAVKRNTQTAKVNEELRWNDLLTTGPTGRARAGLTDGSILSVGSDSELLIVQHDSVSQQTSLQMNFGKVRSHVVKITKPGGKFELETPNAVIGVIGTDFYVAYEPQEEKTTVICYEGRVSVTPIGNAKVSQTSGTTGSQGAIFLEAGQMVEITSVVPAGGFQVSETPSDVRLDSLLATEVEEAPPSVHHFHKACYIAAGIVAVGLGLSIYFGGRGGGGKRTAAPSTNCRNGSPTCL